MCARVSLALQYEKSQIIQITNQIPYYHGLDHDMHECETNVTKSNAGVLVY
jgi:hypothetical protein